MDPGVLALLIPILAIVLIFGGRIVTRMLEHQQRMAELLHRNQQVADPRIDALQRDMADLKDLVHQQTIALDRLTTPLPSAEIRERIGG